MRILRIISILVCTLAFAVQPEPAAAASIAAASAALAQVVPSKCFPFFGEPLESRLRGRYEPAYPLSYTSTVEKTKVDELATAHLAEVGHALIPIDFVNGLLTDISAQQMPSAVAAAAYDPLHAILGLYLAGPDDNTTWFVTARSGPRGIAIHEFTWLRSSKFRIGIGTTEDTLRDTFGKPRPLTRCGMTAFVYHTSGAEGGFGYTFILRNARVIAMRYTLGI